MREDARRLLHAHSKVWSALRQLAVATVSTAAPAHSRDGIAGRAILKGRLLPRKVVIGCTASVVIRSPAAMRRSRRRVAQSRFRPKGPPPKPCMTKRELSNV
jgi:hypothetical protein